MSRPAPTTRPEPVPADLPDVPTRRALAGRLVRPARPSAEGDAAWGVLSTLLAGMLLYGGIGAGLDRLTGRTALFLPVGLLLGLVSGLYLVVARHGRAVATPAEVERHRRARVLAHIDVPARTTDRETR